MFVLSDPVTVQSGSDLLAGLNLNPISFTNGFGSVVRIEGQVKFENPTSPVSSSVLLIDERTRARRLVGKLTIHGDVVNRH